MKKEQAYLGQQVGIKRREIAQDVHEERHKMERRMSELEAERDDAKAAAEGAQQSSDRLAKELKKVHDQYAKYAEEANDPLKTGIVPGGDSGAKPGSAAPQPAGVKVVSKPRER